MVNMNSAAPSSRSDAAVPTVKSTLYVLAMLFLIVSLLGVGAAYALTAYFRSVEMERSLSVPTESHAIAIGAQRYSIPASLLIDPAQRRDGFAERIDLMLALPIGTGGTLSETEITLMPRGRVRTSAALLDDVYLHQFADDQLSGPIGLVGKPLHLDVGTRGETVWYDPLSANPFVAKCMLPVEMRPGARSCLRVFSLSDRNTAIVTFDPTLLDNWRSFDAVVEDAIAMLRL